MARLRTCTGRPARLTSWTSKSRASRPGWGPSSTPSPSLRIAPSRRRISASAVRPACSTRPSASRSTSRVCGSLWRTAPTWSTITLIAWATMSCSSRPIRARSSATAIRAAASRSRSAKIARISAASLPLGESRPHLRRLGLLGPLPQGVAGNPGDDVSQRNEDHEADRMRARDAVDDDQDASQHDREADSGLPVVAQVFRAGTRWPAPPHRDCR